MSAPIERTDGIVMLCDADGKILDVVRRDAGAPVDVVVEARLADVVDRASASDAERFLETLRAQRATFGWELTFPNGGRPVTLQVAGSEVDGALLVIGAASRSDVAELFDGLVRIDGEQAAEQPAVWSESALRERERDSADRELYEELARVNNDLATSQRALAKSNASLARLNEQKNRFLGMAAHDIRNPLDVIRTYSQFLIEDLAGSLDPKHAEFLQIVESSSGFLLGLVDDLLDIAKIEAGRLDLDRRHVDVASLVAHNVERNRLLAERKRIDLMLSAVDGAPPLWLDANKVEQVLNNLVGNAIKYSPEGSVVDVRVETDGESLSVSVTNPGRGIAPSDLDGIFDAFVTGVARGTAGERSTGLGLAIAKRIVEGHDGSIRVESSPGGETTFTVTLPLHAAAAASKSS